MRLGIGDHQRLEIQVVQAAVGNNKYFCIARQQRFCRRNERAIESAAIFGCESVLRAIEGDGDNAAPWRRFPRREAAGIELSSAA